MDQHDAKTAEVLLREWTSGESLVKHGLSVAACTESYGKREAERLGLEREAAARLADTYRSAGLLHDLDYERHPSLDEHPFHGAELLGIPLDEHIGYCLAAMQAHAPELGL